MVWDIDGTLVDSEPAHHEALLATCRHYGVDLDDLDPAMFVGVHIDDVWEALRPRLAHAVDRATWQRRICDTYCDGMERVAAQQSAVAVMRQLERAGVAQACVSNSSREIVDANLAALGVTDLVRFSISLDDVRHGKPDPEGYSRACERLGAAPHEVAAVEDSATGLASAKAAGLFAIAYWPIGAGDPPPALAPLSDVLIRDLPSVPRLLGISLTDHALALR